MKKFIVVLVASGGCLHAAPPIELPQGPGPDQNLKLQAPISLWDDALPLGNGLMGGLLWGEGSKLRLSLDRGDLWDERTHAEKEWWSKYTYAKGSEMINAGKPEVVNRWWDSKGTQAWIGFSFSGYSCHLHGWGWRKKPCAIWTSLPAPLSPATDSM